MTQMTIGRLARAAGVHVETVRYYQRRGLMEVPTRPAGSVRRYPAQALAALRFIRRAQAVGFTLQETKQLLRLQLAPACRDARSIAEVKLVAVEQRIAELERVRGTLRELVGQCERAVSRSCPIIESLLERDSEVRQRGDHAEIERRR